MSEPSKTNFQALLVPVVLTALLSIGGTLILGYGKFSGDSASVELRLRSLEEYRGEHSKTSVTRDDLNQVRNELKAMQSDYVTKSEFNQFANNTSRQLDDVGRKMDRMLEVVVRGRK